MRSIRWTAAVVALGIVLGVAPFAQALPYVINDPYQGQHPTGGGPASQAADVIGDYADFDVHSITVSMLSPALTTVSGRFNWHGGDPSLAEYVDFGATMRVGDLLMSTNGHQYGVALVSHDGLDAGDLYSITGTRTSDYYLGSFANYLYWRFNTPVRMDPTGATDLGVGTSTVSNVGGNELEAVLNFSTSSSFWNDVAHSGIITMSFASAICANDIVSGTVQHAVPEASSLGLIGVGLVLAGVLPGTLRRRRKSRPPAGPR